MGLNFDSRAVVAGQRREGDMTRGSSVRSIFLASMWLIINGTFSLVAPTGVRAQALQGEIDGNVTDSTQGAIVGARVVATNTETNFSRAGVTNSSGAYTLPDLPPGPYTISVTAPGLQIYNQTGIAVSANAVRRADLTLTVGQVSETVTVEALAAALQTDRSDVRAEMT